MSALRIQSGKADPGLAAYHPRVARKHRRGSLASLTHAFLQGRAHGASLEEIRHALEIEIGSPIAAPTLRSVIYRELDEDGLFERVDRATYAVRSR